MHNHCFQYFYAPRDFTVPLTSELLFNFRSVYGEQENFRYSKNPKRTMGASDITLLMDVYFNILST